jgi:hypothetical protein
VPFIVVEIIPKTLYNIINWNGKEVISITLQQKIKVACDTAGMSLTELGAKMGMSQASISKRVKTGKFTQEELQEMAAFMGCKYESKFIFPDGNEVK